MSRILGYVTSWLDAIPETEQEWIGKLEELKATERRAGWEFAKWLQWGVRQYSRTVEDIAHQVGYSPHTLANILSAMNNSAAAIAQEKELTMSHAVEVLGLPEDEKIALLTEAAENSWSVRKLSFMVNQQKYTNMLSGSLTGSAPLNDNSLNVETYQNNGEGRTALVLPSQSEGYAWDTITEQWISPDAPDDVPFSHVPLSIDIAEPVKAFEVAEYIVAKWGKQFAADVAGEVSRWW